MGMMSEDQIEIQNKIEDAIKILEKHPDFLSDGDIDRLSILIDNYE